MPHRKECKRHEIFRLSFSWQRIKSHEFDLQIECLNPFWREEEETKEDIASWVAAWHFPCVIEKDGTRLYA